MTTNQLLGVHTHWTKPVITSGYDREMLNVPGNLRCSGTPLTNRKRYRLANYEILTTILSAITWKNINHGKMALYTDLIGLSHFDELDILDIYDEVNVDVLESIPPAIDPGIFWAGCKFFVYQDLEPPFCHLDMDFILWKDKRSFFNDYDVVFTHHETIEGVTYVSPQKILKPKGYELPSANWNVDAGNVSLLYIGNNSFKNLYIQEGIRFMDSNDELDVPDNQDDSPRRIVFAEQRLLTALASYHKYSFQPLIGARFHSDFNIWKDERGYDWVWHHKAWSDADDYPPSYPWDDSEDLTYSHTWFLKTSLMRDPHLRNYTCKWLIRRILTEEPRFIRKLKGIDCINVYLEEMGII